MIEPFKYFSTIVIAILLALISNYFLKNGFVITASVIAPLLIGYTSTSRNNVKINGALFGYFFLFVLIFSELNPPGMKHLVRLGMLSATGSVTGIIICTFGYLMKEKLVIWLTLILLLFVSLEVFIISDNNPVSSRFPFFATMLIAFFFSLKTTLEEEKICFVTTVIGIAALIVKIIIEKGKNPSSHNLFPFEILIDAPIVFVTSLIGSKTEAALRSVKFK
jgi:hypothetical protein